MSPDFERILPPPSDWKVTEPKHDDVSDYIKSGRALRVALRDGGICADDMRTIRVALGWTLMELQLAEQALIVASEQREAA